jgi:N-acetylglucosamine-6-phosphate deacetylase
LFVTDCIRAGGLGDGETELGGQPVRVRGGAARLADGTLAGSVLTLDRALRNALSAGVPLTEASSLLSGAPARYLGLGDRGQIAVGLRADLVALDDRYMPTAVYVAGRPSEPGGNKRGIPSLRGDASARNGLFTNCQARPGYVAHSAGAPTGWQ